MISKEILNTKEYDFLVTNEHLRNRIILLGLSGSYSYGTNNDSSDIGHELLNNKKLFLSKRAIQSFGGYAGAQLMTKSANEIKRKTMHI